MEVLYVEEILRHTNDEYFVWEGMGIIAIIVGAVMMIRGIIIHNDNWFGFGAVLAMAATIVSIIFANLIEGIPTTKLYHVTIDSDTSFHEIADNYYIVRQNGKEYILQEKEGV